jgi:hypothetical protein
MEIEIRSVKLKKNSSPVLSYHQTVDDRKSGELTYEKGPGAHPDFKGKVSKLAVHYGILTGYIKPGAIKNIAEYADPIVESFYVSGFSVSGEDEDEGVVLTGHRVLPNGKAIILNTPFYRFNEDDKTRYKFMDELMLAIEDCKDEAKQYLNGKVEKDPQGELGFTEEESK